jgi:periplasmic protein CpxP/Spy
MKRNYFLLSLILVVLFGLTAVGCHPKMDTMTEARKIFVKMISKAASKLDLNDDQKIQLERLKADIRKNFDEGRIENMEAMKKIKEEGKKENPDIQQMTATFQGTLQNEVQRVNQAFNMMIDFQKNLNDDQKKKLTGMIVDWIKKWD